MVSSPNKPPKSEEESTKRLDHQVRDLVTDLARRLSELSSNAKSGAKEPSRHIYFVDDDENGIRVLTLAGTNTGATMRADLSDGLSDNTEVPGTYANSNCQAVNNSIMMSGSYTAEDPGVHVFIYEHAEDEGEDGKGKGKEKEKKQEHKKEKEREVSGGKTSKGEE